MTIVLTWLKQTNYEALKREYEVLKQENKELGDSCPSALLIIRRLQQR